MTDNTKVGVQRKTKYCLVASDASLRSAPVKRSGHGLLLPAVHRLHTIGTFSRLARSHRCANLSCTSSCLSAQSNHQPSLNGQVVIILQQWGVVYHAELVAGLEGERGERGVVRCGVWARNEL